MGCGFTFALCVASGFYAFFKHVARHSENNRVELRAPEHFRSLLHVLELALIGAVIGVLLTVNNWVVIVAILFVAVVMQSVGRAVFRLDSQRDRFYIR